jgi:membrane protease YdiL (CAAX protease family)
VTHQHEYPGIGQAIWLLFLAALLMAGAGVLAGVLLAFLRFRIQDFAASLAISELLAIGLTLLWGFRKTRAPLREVFPFVPIRRVILFPMLLTVIGCIIVLSELDNAVLLVLPIPPRYAVLFSAMMGPRAGFWGPLLALVIVAPLTEELLFRGLILHGFLSRYGVRKAILTSAVLFGAFHLNPWQLLPATVIGMVFGWWLVRTGSLIPCIAGHAVFNGVPWVLVRFLHLDIPGFVGGSARAEFQPLWFDLAGLLLAAAGILLTVRALSYLTRSSRMRGTGQ